VTVKLGGQQNRTHELTNYLSRYKETSQQFTTGSLDTTVRMWGGLDSYGATTSIEYWGSAPMPQSPPPTAFMSLQMICYQRDTKGKTLLSRAAEEANVEWLMAFMQLFKKPHESARASGCLAAAMVQRDLEGRSVLDHALHPRAQNSKVLQLLLEASLQVPPKAREGLMNRQSQEGSTIRSVLICLAESFPLLLAKYLKDVDLDQYENTTNVVDPPPPKQKAQVRGHSQQIGAPDRVMSSALIAKAGDRRIAFHGNRYASAPEGLFWTPLRKQTEKQKPGNDDLRVDVECRVVGVPGLMLSKKNKAEPEAIDLNDCALFDAMVAAGATTLEIMDSAVMQCAIEFKWRTYARYRWVWSLLLLLLLIILSLFGTFLLNIEDNYEYASFPGGVRPTASPPAMPGQPAQPELTQRFQKDIVFHQYLFADHGDLGHWSTSTVRLAGWCFYAAGLLMNTCFLAGEVKEMVEMYYTYLNYGKDEDGDYCKDEDGTRGRGGRARHGVVCGMINHRKLKHLQHVLFRYFSDPWQLVDTLRIVVMYILLGLFVAEEFAQEQTTARYVVDLPGYRQARRWLSAALCMLFYLKLLSVLKGFRQVPPLLFDMYMCMLFYLRSSRASARCRTSCRCSSSS